MNIYIYVWIILICIVNISIDKVYFLSRLIVLVIYWLFNFFLNGYVYIFLIWIVSKVLFLGSLIFIYIVNIGIGKVYFLGS